MTKSFRSLLTAALLIAGLTRGSAQAAAVTLRGVVQDVTTAYIPGAEVVIRSGAREIARLQTDRAGGFSFVAAEGAYDVRARSEGFRPLSSPGTRFYGGEAVTLTLQISMNSGPVVTPLPEMSVAQPLPGTTLSAAAGGQSAAANAGGLWEYGVQVAGGIGLQDRSNFGFFNLGVHGGRVLIPSIGSGHLQGSFEYGIEAMPFWQSYTPTFQRILCPPNTVSAAQCSVPYTVGGTFTGVSATPIILRYNLTHGTEHGGRLMPWVQGAGGVVWTSKKYPAVGNLNPLDPSQTGFGANTSQWNFTPQGGVGVHYFLKPKRSVDFGLNVIHISSASLGDKNPGVNSSLQFVLGYSWWK